MSKAVDKKKLVVLYDGVCAVCNGFVRFILPRDPEGRFHFAPIQGPSAAEVLARWDRDPSDLDTMYLIKDFGGPNEQLLERSAAIFETFRTLGGVWRWFSFLAILPRVLTDFGYSLVVRNRYRLFGRHDTCMLPPPGSQTRFLDPDFEG